MAASVPLQRAAIHPVQLKKPANLPEYDAAGNEKQPEPEKTFLQKCKAGTLRSCVFSVLQDS